MCNLYRQTKSVDEVARLFRDIALPLSFPEGIPNLPPVDIGITDPGGIVRCAAGDRAEAQFVVRRWSWPGTNAKPVYNFRSEGREFPAGRCLILAYGFYEFTAPSDPAQKRKDRWLFTSRHEPFVGIAGLVRDVQGIGEAFTMLTTEPGPDMAPYHNRQVVVLPSAAWRGWLDYSVAAREVLRPAVAGMLKVQHMPR